MTAEDGRAHATPRLHFHIALGAVFFPVLSLPLTATLSIVNLAKRNPHPAHRLWTRRLLLLAVADLLYAAAMIVVVVSPDDFDRPAQPPSPKIGVVFDPDAEDSTRITQVVEGWPAERAGIRVGDRIEAIDEVPVTSYEEILESISGGRPGAARTFMVRRDGEPLSFSVAPESSPPIERAELFEVLPRRDPPDRLAKVLTELAPVAGVILFAVIYAAVKGARPLPVWAAFVLALGGTYGGTAILSAIIGASLGGFSRGSILLLLSAQMILMLGLTGVVAYLMRKSPGVRSDPSPPAGPFRTLLMAVLYLIGGVPRIASVLYVAGHLLFEGGASGTRPIESLMSGPLGPLGVTILVVTAVFVGPLAEEALFRGFLLPRLAAQVSTRWGIVVSAAIFALLHLHYMILIPVAFFYGFVFGWARMRSGTLWVPFALHLAINGLATTVHLLR